MSDKRIILISGASRGIGLEIARTLRDKNTIFAITYQSEEAKRRLQEEFDKDELILLNADVSNEDQVKNLVDDVFNRYKKIDILINNAGITADSLAIRMSGEDFRKVIDTNLNGAFYLTREVAKHMIKKRSGKIIFISSVVGLHGNIGQVNYAAAKSGMIGMMKTFALELSKRNINVNAVAPGFIETKMTEALSDEVRKKYTENIPLNRLGLTKDIANCVKFLCSEDASYITGQVISVDGGLNI